MAEPPVSIGSTRRCICRRHLLSVRVQAPLDEPRKPSCDFLDLCEIGPQDRRYILALAQQPDHIQMVAAFEVAPQQRELCDLPGPKPWNTHLLAQHRRAYAGSSSIWSSAALVAFATFTATRVPPSLR